MSDDISQNQRAPTILEITQMAAQDVMMEQGRAEDQQNETIYIVGATTNQDVLVHQGTFLKIKDAENEKQFKLFIESVRISFFLSNVDNAVITLANSTLIRSQNTLPYVAGLKLFRDEKLKPEIITKDIVTLVPGLPFMALEEAVDILGPVPDCFLNLFVPPQQIPEELKELTEIYTKLINQLETDAPVKH